MGYGRLPADVACYYDYDTNIEKKRSLKISSIILYILYIILYLISKLYLIIYIRYTHTHTICSASYFLDYFTSFPNCCTMTGLALIPVLQ